jgi:predicted metal-dependent phosphoesterase TrpH
MVDLHAHSNRSDGELSPAEVVELARRRGLTALALTDHDSIEGYEDGLPHARRLGLELVCGVELSSRFRGRPVHVLGYFLDRPPDEEFRGHLACLQKARRDRNERLAARLCQLGLEVRLEEAEALGRSQTGRPHFARVLVRKGYVGDVREAFGLYLDEGAPGYVERREASLQNVLSWIRKAGGLSSWAHPGRFLRGAAAPARELFREMAAQGLDAVEVYHTDHDAGDCLEFLRGAKEAGLGITGGSDFHGPASRAELGSLNLPDSLLEELREHSRAKMGGRH